MAFFRNNTKRILEEFKHRSEYFSNDLSKEIKESFEDLKSDYDENSNIVPEFLEFAEALKEKLSSSDAEKLDEFSSKLRKVNRSAKNGVEAMRDLSYNQRKLTAETLRFYDEFE